MKKYISSVFKVYIWAFFLLSGSVYGQELSLKETLSYIENLLISELKEELSIPNTIGPSNVKNYEVILDYENLVIKTILKDNTDFIHKTRLVDATFSVKYSPEKYYDSARIYKPAFHIVFINETELPALAFLHKEDADRIIKALSHLKTFCKSDPFK